MLELPPGDPASTTVPPPTTGSAAEAAGEELLSAAVDLPWDDWLGAGAVERVRDGSLGVVRTAWPATAARDMRAAATPEGMLGGDLADRERLGAVAVAVAAAHARPTRMPHGPGEEPYAWWVAAERTLVWMPWVRAAAAPYGLELLESGQADAVTVAAPDACWTVFRSGLPRRGARGAFAALPQPFRDAVLERAPDAAAALARNGRWQRRGDTLMVQWRDAAGRVRTASIGVNRWGALSPRSAAPPSNPKD